MTSSFDWTPASWLPAARPVSEAVAAPEMPEPPAEPSAGDLARVRCDECGTVESVRHMDGGHVITVRMRDGTLQSFEDRSPAAWRPGERAIVIIGRGPAD